MGRWLAIGAVWMAAACGSSHAAEAPDGGTRRIDAGALPAFDAGGPGVDAGPPTHRPPPRPDVEDAPSVPEVAYLITDVRWDPAEEWSSIGFDLDGIVTAEPDRMVECTAPAASAEPELDGDGGIDNVLGHQIVPLLVLALPDLASQARALQAEGTGALLVRIRDWNGAADDPLVTADVFVTAGYDASGAIVLDEELLVDGDLESPHLRIDNAWIAGGTLVAHLPDRAPLRLAYGPGVATVPLAAATLTVDLDGAATLAGRWAIADVLSNADELGLCGGMDGDSYRMLSRLLDLAADLRAVPGTGGPGATCDAISAALPFDTVRPATIARAAPMPALTPYCP